MSDRVKRDDSLKDIADVRILHRPVIIVEMVDGDTNQFRIFPSILDPSLNEPRLFGILLSDAVDHIAAAYHNISGRDERALREIIFKAMRDEDRFKEKDPGRGANRATMTMPRGN